MQSSLEKEKSNWFKRHFWWIFKYKIVRHNEFYCCPNCAGNKMCEEGVRNCPCKWSYQHLAKRWK